MATGMIGMKHLRLQYLSGNTVVLVWYDADDGNMVISTLKDTGAAIDGNFNLATGTVTDLVNIAMSTTDYASLGTANFEVIQLDITILKKNSLNFKAVFFV